MDKRIGTIIVDLVHKEIRVTDVDGTPVVWPLSSSGGTIIRYGKTGVGGCLVHALELLLHDLHRNGGNSV